MASNPPQTRHFRFSRTSLGISTIPKRRLAEPQIPPTPVSFLSLQPAFTLPISHLPNPPTLTLPPFSSYLNIFTPPSTVYHTLPSVRNKWMEGVRLCLKIRKNLDGGLFTFLFFFFLSSSMAEAYGNLSIFRFLSSWEVLWNEIELTQGHG